MSKVLFIIAGILLSNILCQSPDVSLGEGYKLITSASGWGLTIVDERNVVVITTDVRETKFDSIFIICAQTPVDSFNTEFIGLNLTEKESIFENSTMRYFWIIDKRQKFERNANGIGYVNVHGPFSKREYLQHKQLLLVPKSLKLSWEDEQ